MIRSDDATSTPARAGQASDGEYAPAQISAEFARPDLTAAGRECGDCSLCCTVLRVDELNKLGGTPCEQLASGGGCGIHARRPAICRNYRCLWLRGAFDEEDRPDRLGAVVDFAPEGASIRLVIEEAEPGNFERSPRLQAIAAKFRDSIPVRVACAVQVMNPDRPYRLLLPGGGDERVTGEWVESLRDGKVVSRRRSSWFARLARRLQLRWQSSKLKRARVARTAESHVARRSE